MSLVKSTATIGIFTLISRVFGYVRDMLTAHLVGANDLSDAFFVAFKLPNYFRRIFAEGAFNSAFVPLYSSYASGEGEAKARAFAQDAFSALAAILLALTVVVMVIMPWFMLLLAPGFSDNPAKFELTVTLTRITFPYLLFISLVSLLGGILNSMGKFGAVAATPIIMNLCFIFALLFLAPYTQTPVHAMAYGVLISGCAQYAWLMWFCKKVGVMPSFKKPVMNENVKKLLTLVAPAALGSSVAQINLMIDTILASQLPNNGVSYLYYADRMSELPLAVIGIAIGTVLLPALSRHRRAGDHAKAIHQQNRALELALLLTLPSAGGLMMLAQPLMQVMFERGAFSAADTLACASALQAFAVGLPAFVLVKIFAPGFYAQHDTKTPFKIAAFCVLVNLVLNLVLMGPFLHVGMALATSVASWVNVLLLVIVLHKRGLFLLDAACAARIPAMVVATLVMCAAVAALDALWLAPYFAQGLGMKIMALTVLVAGGGVVYGVSALACAAVDPAQLKRLVWR